MDVNKFVENLEILCKIKGISATKACLESGLSRSFLTDIKSKSPNPRIESLQKLANYFGVSISELLGEITIPNAITSEEQQVLAAYRKADTRAKEMVRLALEPFGLSASSDKAM